MSAQWHREETPKKLGELARAEICFWADAALCRHIGLFGESRRIWLDLRDSERIAYSRKGPPATHAIRRRLFAMIMEVLDADAT